MGKIKEKLCLSIMKMGYATLEIRNPKDLVEYESD
jgi:hypothetical protein